MTAPAKSILECRQVGLVVPDSDGVGRRRVLEGISVQVRAGEILSVIGPSGSGKSSLLRLLNRFDDPTEGEVRFQGKPLATYDPLELRRRIALVLQTPVMFEGSVRDNLRTRPRGAGGDLTEEVMSMVLKDVGLEGAFLDRKAADLSGGEKQRVAIARILLGRPEVLMLDEPTSALDPRNLVVVADLIRDLHQRQGLTVIVVTHRPELIQRIGGALLFLVEGRPAGAAKDATAFLADPPAGPIRTFLAGDT